MSGVERVMSALLELPDHFENSVILICRGLKSRDNFGSASLPTKNGLSHTLLGPLVIHGEILEPSLELADNEKTLISLKWIKKYNLVVTYVDDIFFWVPGTTMSTTVGHIMEQISVLEGKQLAPTAKAILNAAIGSFLSAKDPGIQEGKEYGVRVNQRKQFKSQSLKHSTITQLGKGSFLFKTDSVARKPKKTNIGNKNPDFVNDPFQSMNAHGLGGIVMIESRMQIMCDINKLSLLDGVKSIQLIKILTDSVTFFITKASVRRTDSNILAQLGLPGLDLVHATKPGAFKCVRVSGFPLHFHTGSHLGSLQFDPNLDCKDIEKYNHKQ